MENNLANSSDPAVLTRPYHPDDLRKFHPAIRDDSSGFCIFTYDLKRLFGTIKVTNLKLEIAGKNKKLTSHQKRLSTPAKSASEVQINSLGQNASQPQ